MDDPQASGDRGVFVHVPVLLDEVVEVLLPALRDGGPLVDCTVGAGGHSEALLSALGEFDLVGLDRDGQALAAAGRRLEPFGERVHLLQSDFADIGAAVRRLGMSHAGAVLYDLGVSSPQLDRPERGFGYRPGFVLDMRMDNRSGSSARDVVNSYPEHRLKSIIARYGEERFAGRIARAIVSRRARKPFDEAGDLADVVRSAIPAATRRTGSHPARRTFQALRIEVNRELDSLKESMAAALDLLRPGGRVAAISYHSLEDRIVKDAFREAATGCICPKGFPVCRCGQTPDVRVVTSKPLRPGDDEVARNPRSDSARLRAAEKLGARN